MPEKHKFSGTNQKPERQRPFGTGLVRHCPQGLFSPFFTFLRATFFRPFRLSLVPTICPWVSEDEGKTVLDTHFAHVSHKMVRWVRMGKNLDSGEQLANLLEVWIIKTTIEVHCFECLHGFSVRHTIFTLA